MTYQEWNLQLESDMADEHEHLIFNDWSLERQLLLDALQDALDLCSKGFSPRELDRLRSVLDAHR